jgi:fructose-bisphosphate aldolase class II
LVLHGGSNNRDDEIREAVNLGINKINISSDIKAAYFMKMREVLNDLSLREPNVIQPSCIAAMKEVAYQRSISFLPLGKHPYINFRFHSEYDKRYCTWFGK